MQERFLVLFKAGLDNLRKFAARKSRRASLTVILISILFLPTIFIKDLFAQKPSECRAERCYDIECARKRTLCLLSEGNVEEAIKLLKGEKEEFLGKKEFHLLLSKAYSGQNNHFWAIRVLNEYLDYSPEDCEVESWIAWMYLREGDLEGAEGILNNDRCLGKEERIASRFVMLRTFLQIQKSEEVRESEIQINGERQIKGIFPEDIELYQYNKSVLHPNYIIPFSLRVEIGSGYATNALMGSPNDPAISDVEMDSLLMFLDFWSNFLIPISKWVNSSIEVQGKSIYFSREGPDPNNYPKQYSYFDAGIKPGLLFLGDDYQRLFIGYKGNYLFINKATKYEEAPVFLYEGHRGEIEFSPTSNFTLFAGAGRRIFNEMVRTRWELDGGLGWGKKAFGPLFILGAVTMRYFKARSPGYNDFGITGLVSPAFTGGKGTQIKTLVSLGMDDYFDSKEYFEPGKKRKDTSIKANASVFTPTRKGLKVGLVYEFSDKLSTVSAYEYTDHRVILKIVGKFSFDPWGPKEYAEKRHIPLDYGLEIEGEEDVSRQIQELLQQDESVRRGSSCRD